ncbi:MAG: dethiobiotin synthase [Myxococcales bacterium]
MRRPRGRGAGLFVAGTDTGVGKTFVASAVCLALRRSGRPVAGLKPFESGCHPFPADAEALEEAAQSGLALDLRCPYRYREAVAPAVASARLREPRAARLAGAIRLVQEAARERFVVVEGAGGLLSPLDGRRTNLDLARALGFPVLLVARNALGTLNHAGLAVEALSRRRLRLAAIVLSAVEATDPSQRDNAAWMRRLVRVRNVVALPRCKLEEASRLLARRLAPQLPVG